jgi:hypothetical protein
LQSLRAPTEEVKPLLEKVEGDAQVAGYDATKARTVVLNILIKSIAWVGSKSLSHVLSWLSSTSL